MYKNMKIPLLFYVSLYLGGCSQGISGDYGGEGCLYEMSFKPDGKVYISGKIFGIKSPESEGTYEVDGERVVVRSSDRKNIIFRKKDDSLVTDLLGAEVECRKL